MWPSVDLAGFFCEKVSYIFTGISVWYLYLAAELDETVLLAADNLERFNNYQPSLHTLAELFLGNGARQFFKVIILIML